MGNGSRGPVDFRRFEDGMRNSVANGLERSWVVCQPGVTVRMFEGVPGARPVIAAPARLRRRTDRPRGLACYRCIVGKGALPIVDTCWQIGTDGALITPLPGATPMTRYAGIDASGALLAEQCVAVWRIIGILAVPDHLHLLSGLPRTCSGQLVRYSLGKVARNDFVRPGDPSLRVDPGASMPRSMVASTADACCVAARSAHSAHHETRRAQRA